MLFKHLCFLPSCCTGLQAVLGTLRVLLCMAWIFPLGSRFDHTLAPTVVTLLSQSFTLLSDGTATLSYNKNPSIFQNKFFTKG